MIKPEISLRDLEMRDAQILNLLDSERQHVNDPGTTLIQTRYTTRALGPENSWCGIVYSQFSEAEAATAVAQEVEYFKTLRRDFEWKVYSHDQPTGLLDRLRALGFRVGEEESLMIREIKNLPAELREAEPGSKVTVHPVTGSSGAEDYIAVEAAIWPEDHYTKERLLAAIDSPDRSNQLFVAYDGNTPVGCGRVTAWTESRFAGLWGGGVLPLYRNRGIYRALLAARIRNASQVTSVEYLRVDALPTSRPILEKYGFRRIASTWPADSPRPVTE